MSWGVHVLMTDFASIRHFHGEAGLQEVLFESDVFGFGSVQNIFSEKSFTKLYVSI